jgi:1-acyl-sn-glycerol-3-phosphate acyltransferase
VNVFYWLGYNLSRLVGRCFFQFKVLHRERMIQSGPAILVMNHQSYLDPPLAGSTCNRAIYFLARRSLLNNPVLGWLLPKLNVIPVNQETIDRTGLKNLIQIIKAGNAALVFPEGSRTPDGELHAGLPGVGLIIAKTRAPVVPMRIFGAFEAWPIGGKIRRHPITVVVGQPIHFNAAQLGEHGKEVYAQLSQRIMDEIAALRLE